MHREEKDRSILGIARHVLHIINTHTQACIKDGAIHKIIKKKSLQIYKDASSLVWKLVSGWSASDCCYPSGDSFPLRPHQLGPPVPAAQRQVRRDVFFFFFSPVLEDVTQSPADISCSTASHRTVSHCNMSRWLITQLTVEMDTSRAQEIDLAHAIMILPSCLPALELSESDIED